MELNDYQDRANRTDQRPGNDEQALAFPLLGLASEVGSLVNQYKKRIRDGQAHALFNLRAGTELGDILWYVANLSNKLGHSLEDIAQYNLRRINERWSTGNEDEPALLLDDGFPPHEQLPRTIDVRFREISLPDGRVRVQLVTDSRELGDPLSDMSWTDAITTPFTSPTRLFSGGHLLLERSSTSNAIRTRDTARSRTRAARKSSRKPSPRSCSSTQGTSST
jgi:NTP pyrophosphatase (non-canonical NTP hydrolase)